MKNKGLTIIEMLTVVVVMAIIIGLVAPAGVQIINKAKETKQKAQFTAMNIGIESFRNDHDYYPPSDSKNAAGNNGMSDYCGSQKLAEAMVGYDLFGFHPKTEWTVDGTLENPTKYGNDYEDNRENFDLLGRNEPYIKPESVDAIPLAPGSMGNGYFISAFSENLVLCDTFKKKNDNLNKKIGTPILYYRARPNKVEFDGSPMDDQIFDYLDNWMLVAEGTPDPDGRSHDDFTVNDFYDPTYLVNENVSLSGNFIPYNKDSFILISAGKDGLYGTEDDIFNFEKSE